MAASWPTSTLGVRPVLRQNRGRLAWRRSVPLGQAQHARSWVGGRSGAAGPGSPSACTRRALAQGEVLEGELPVAAAEERKEAKQVVQRADHGGPGKINCLSAGRGFVEGQAALAEILQYFVQEVFYAG